MVFATYGTTCWICSHGGARTVDHVLPVTERPDLALVLTNCRPAHGGRNRCAQCGQCCNQLKAGMSVDRARRIIAERAPAAAPRQAEIPADTGRDW
jgi:hypothetical protein